MGVILACAARGGAALHISAFPQGGHMLLILLIAKLIGKEQDMLRKEVENILLQVQKPARYVGGELHAAVKDKDSVDIRFAFCFPDVYEIGMSHLGMKILYGLLNTREDTWCERVFAPWTDMEAIMRERNIPLFALESGDPLSDFDIVGFTLQYELSYTNVLNMLDLAGIPLRAKERTSLSQLVIAGGPCVCNAEPMADFFDIILLGEGEEALPELLELYKKFKLENASKAAFLQAAAQICGVYVPAFYDIGYHEDGTLREIVPLHGAPAKVKKRVVADLNNMYYPDCFVLPFMDVVHDRAMAEIFRGCIRGCRFCQAGFIYRPIREKSAETVDTQLGKLCANTGYDEASLVSLSTSDYTEFPALLARTLPWTQADRVNLSLPSLRIDNFSDELVERLQTVRRSGLTFAPEAGTQRLRDVINKNITEADILKTAEQTFRGGWTSVKLYFMLGLPTETLADVEGIAALAQKVVDAYYRNPEKPKGKSVSVNVSVASFVPKPFTPFQWEPQDTMDTLAEKQKALVGAVTSRKISVSRHDVPVSFLEGVLARGDRRLSGVIEKAWKKGCRFDSWSDLFQFEIWLQSFKECGLDPAFYANRKREDTEILPWDHMDYGISKSFLLRERDQAYTGHTTPHCREKCSGCGANRLNGGACDALL